MFGRTRYKVDLRRATRPAVHSPGRGCAQPGAGQATDHLLDLGQVVHELPGLDTIVDDAAGGWTPLLCGLWRTPLHVRRRLSVRHCSLRPSERPLGLRCLLVGRSDERQVGQRLGVRLPVVHTTRPQKVGDLLGQCSMFEFPGSTNCVLPLRLLPGQLNHVLPGRVLNFHWRGQHGIATCDMREARAPRSARLPRRRPPQASRARRAKVWRSISLISSNDRTAGHSGQRPQQLQQIQSRLKQSERAQTMHAGKQV